VPNAGEITVLFVMACVLVVVAAMTFVIVAFLVGLVV
jgi:hypothetical protein